MLADHHHWMTLHRVRFPSEISALEHAFEVPTRPDCWRFCPGQRLGENGLPTWTSDIWCGLGIYGRQSDAEAMATSPEQHLPFLSDSIEHWHAVLIPVAHRGIVNWRGEIENGTAIRSTKEKLAGPLAVVTTAGFDSREPDQFPRIARFVRGVQDVLDFYKDLDGNVRAAVYNGGFDRRDGFTLTLWRDEEAMMQAAYWDGPHRTLMDASRDGSLFDRSSFTRARIVFSTGSWNGDPVSQMS